MARPLSWEEYYDSFYDWAPTTQRSYVSRLSSFGPAEEVTEIIHEFLWADEAFAGKFVVKAMDAGVRFTPEQVLEFIGFFDKSVTNRMAETTSVPFTREDLEEIDGLIDDAVFKKISRRAKIDIYADDEPEDLFVWEEEVEPPAPKLGFWGALAAVFAGSSITRSSVKRQHNGRCNGDCANCPPHYGYRYGRWYYGHGHVHGCEFGGNKGDGSL